LALNVKNFSLIVLFLASILSLFLSSNNHLIKS